MRAKLIPDHVPIVRKNGISATYNLINFVNGMIGPGCFSVAMAFKQGGLWTSFFLVFFIGTVSTISMHKIVRCSQLLARILGDQSLDYGEMAAAAFRNSFPAIHKYGKAAQFFVNGCLIFFQVGVASILAYFDVDNPFSDKVMLLLYGVPATVINMLKDIRAVTFTCLVGNIFIFAAIGLILEELMTSKHIWQELPWITSFDSVVMCAGSLLYSFEGQAMVLPLENKLKHPRDMNGWTGVLTTGMAFVTIIYTYCGFYGYITYGNAVDGSITLNLPDNTVNIVVKILLVFVVFFGNVLQIYVIAEMIWPPVKKRLEKGETSKFLAVDRRLRGSIDMLGLAVAVPNLQQIIPFIGITAGMLLSLIIPAVLDVVVFLPPKLADGESKLRISLFLAEDVFLFVVGLFFLVSGLQSNVKSMMHS
ncbi:unnamed protein product [Caenorhabditis auriculariae]|uniref:Amino acid transporter transmembrane domain-containing protein n=1 Tax=Caenorhabditis auriculariae TaxID=2777116 RepID=A0A8S1HPX7_9PELO|nr:unnamed protein product [Caenorhabditis auriculariae]